MDERDVFELADRALARVVAQIDPDQWEMVLPATFATRATTGAAVAAGPRELPRLRRRLGARHAGRD